MNGWTEILELPEWVVSDPPPPTLRCGDPLRGMTGKSASSSGLDIPWPGLPPLIRGVVYGRGSM
mgnify:CR=1 FL=1